jgi:CBS domain containing-hemolysin-like protein
MLAGLIILALIAVNALYVAAEFAAVAAERSQLALLARAGNGRAARLLSVLGDGVELDRYIAACQIGITLSSLIAGAYGQATIATPLVRRFEHSFGLEAVTAQTAGFITVLLVLTVLQVVLGELIPKSLALQFPERVALLTYLPLRWSVSAYRGLIWLLNGSGALLLAPFGGARGGQHVHSPEELAILFSESRRGGELSSETHRRLQRGLRLSTLTVRQLMTPRRALYAVEVSLPAAELIQRVIHSPYSRLPVYQGSLDKILGAVSTKDIVESFAARGELPTIERLLRPIPFVPGALRSHDFIRFLQRERSSQAIVVDEHGGVQGIVSIKDVLWQLFGEVGDELAQPEAGVEALPDGSLRLPGSLRRDEVERWLQTRWDGPSTTVGGHIIAVLGRLPLEGEELVIEGIRLTITDMSPTAVLWILAHPRNDGARTSGESSEAGGRDLK